MAIGTGNVITQADVAALRNVIVNECGGSRRGRTEEWGQWQSRGSLNGYYNNANSFYPSQGGVIYASDITKINQPMYYAKTNSASGVSAGSAIALQTLNSYASNLSSIGVTNSSHGCAGNCTGLCYNGCYANCNGCSGSCYGSCHGNCSGGCAGGCSSCQGSCSGCGGGCQGYGCHSGSWADTWCETW